MNNNQIAEIQEKIGYEFNNLSYLSTAFTHASYANEKGVASNERFEFLGDSILNFVIAKLLFDKYPDMDEGFLTKARAKIVSAKPLAEAVERCDIFKFTLLIQGAIGASASTKVKSRLFEAVIGAIMLDSGLDSAEKFILDKLDFVINDNFTDGNLSDSKSKLIELTRREGKTVVFATRAMEDGKSGFTSTVYINDKASGTGEAASKKKAEQIAAMAAMSTNR